MESDEWNSLQRLNSSEIREIERDILHQKEIDRLASIEIQRKKSFDRSQSHSQFYKDYQLLENIWKGCQKNQEKLSSILSSSNQIEIDRLKKKTVASRFRLEGVYQKFANNYPLSEFHIYPDYYDRMNTVVEEIGDWLGKKL